MALPVALPPLLTVPPEEEELPDVLPVLEVLLEAATALACASLICWVCFCSWLFS